MISTRRRGSGLRSVHEMADLGTDTLCGLDLPAPWAYTDDLVDCRRCLAAIARKQREADYEQCMCGHSRYQHRHAEEREVANPDAWARADCQVAGCDCCWFEER